MNEVEKKVYKELRDKLISFEDDKLKGNDRLCMAKLGIMALIDEATGYQEERPKDALAKKLKEMESENEEIDSTALKRLSTMAKKLVNLDNDQ